MNSPELREVYNANLPKLTQYYSELGQNEGLFEKYRQLKAGPDFARLNRAQRAIVEHELRDFRLGGAELPADKKIRFAEIREKLSALTSRFSDNVLDATNAFAHYVEDARETAGIPDDVLQAAQNAARQDGRPGWKFTLHAPSHIPVMQYADNRGVARNHAIARIPPAPLNSATLTGTTPGSLPRSSLRGRSLHSFSVSPIRRYSLEPKWRVQRGGAAFLHDLAVRAKPPSVIWPN
jgi:oligopeptidase A